MNKRILLSEIKLHLLNQSAGVNTDETEPSTPRGLLGEISVILFLLLMFLLLIPNITNASLKINEIMYDPEGTDGGREWIEIYNDSSENINLTEYKFLENNVKHGISPYGETSSEILPNEYLIVADDPSKFLIDYPAFSAKLFDSSFSLNNTGETLSLLDKSGTTTDSVSYLPPENSSGGSLSLFLSNWIYSVPTPGAENTNETPSSEDDSDDSSDSDSSGDSSSHSDPVPVSTYKPTISSLKISAGRNRLATIYQPIKFQVFSNSDEQHFRTEWSLGDGTEDSGRKIEHAYIFPGEYEVLVESSSSQLGKSVSRTKVKIIEPKIKLEIIYPSEIQKNPKTKDKIGVSITNLTDYELNLKGFELVFGKKDYDFDSDTIIGSKKKLIFPERTLKLSLDSLNLGSSSNSSVNYKNLILQYPNGDKLAEFDFSL